MEKAASLPIDKVFDDLNTSENGLTSEEAKLRLKKYGYNKLSEKRQIPIHYTSLSVILKIYLAYCCLLQQSYLISVAAQNLRLIILAVVFVNIFVSIFQESRAEKAMETLKSWMPEYAKVMRDGELKKISVREIVPGDIIDLGRRRPCSSRCPFN